MQIYPTILESEIEFIYLFIFIKAVSHSISLHVNIHSSLSIVLYFLVESFL